MVFSFLDGAFCWGWGEGVGLCFQLGVLEQRWAHHRDGSAMLATLEYLRCAAPVCAIIENVKGFAIGDSGESGYAFFKRKVETELGYYVHLCEADLASWHQMTRKRCFAQCAHKSGWKLPSFTKIRFAEPSSSKKDFRVHNREI